MSVHEITGGDEIGFAEAECVTLGEFMASGLFQRTYGEGMRLVEETSAYLDGAGREAAKALPREASLAYAGESMRLTTRLMQVASWLLVRKAVHEGEMTAEEANSEKYRLATKEIARQPRCAGCGCTAAAPAGTDRAFGAPLCAGRAPLMRGSASPSAKPGAQPSAGRADAARRSLLPREPFRRLPASAVRTPQAPARVRFSRCRNKKAPQMRGFFMFR